MRSTFLRLWYIDGVRPTVLVQQCLYLGQTLWMNNEMGLAQSTIGRGEQAGLFLENAVLYKKFIDAFCFDTKVIYLLYLPLPCCRNLPCNKEKPLNKNNEYGDHICLCVLHSVPVFLLSIPALQALRKGGILVINSVCCFLVTPNFSLKQRSIF